MISVIVVVYNRPDFILPQYDLVEKFLTDDFEYFVYDNSDNPQVTEQFKSICEENGINYFRISQENQAGSDPSTRAGYSLNSALDHNIENYNLPCLVLDSDMFLLNTFCVDDALVENKIIGNLQKRGDIYYYNNQLLCLDLPNLPNFKGHNRFLPGVVNGVTTDCGGWMYNYINDNRISHRGFSHFFSGMIYSDCYDKNLDLFELELSKVEVDNAPPHEKYHERISILDDIIPSYLYDYYRIEIDILKRYMGVGVNFSELFSDCFLHFRAGSNWIGHCDDMVGLRNKNLHNLFQERLSL